jgi:acetylornithine deacetylase
VSAAEILRELVEIPTPSAVSNLPLLDWVTPVLESAGWRVQLFPYADEDGVAKANLIARPACAPHREDPIELAFICHTDTVPYAADWASALELQSLGGTLLKGCGACDVKGALACFLAAIGEMEADQVQPDAALILTADEEVGCKGMERLLAQTSLRIRSAIVSEPTSLRPGIAGKGYGLARVTVRGVEAHSAYPREGLSAIMLAARLIARIESYLAHDAAAPETAGPTASARLPEPLLGDPLFDPPQTTVNIGTIQGGTAKNIVPGECSFLVEWRPIPADPPRAFLARLEQLAGGLAAEHPRARILVEPLRAEPGFEPASAGPLLRRLDDVRAAAALQPHTPAGISFGSEASRLARVANEVIVIGPGDMHTAHSDRECVSLAELEEWTRTLRALLARS